MYVKFLRMFGRYGDGRGELDYCPISIAIDTGDRVFVGNYNHRISVFSSDGQSLTSFGKPGELNYPTGLAVDVSGVVYLCDRGNDRILVSMYLHFYSELNGNPHMYYYF